MNIIGTNIRKLRGERGVTQEQLADKLAISYQAVSKWETGGTVPDTMLLPKIAEFFEVSIDDLFHENMTAYRNRGCRLIALYEQKPDTEIFAEAEKEMLKSIDAPVSEDVYLQAEDLRSLAVLYQKHARFCRDKALEYFDKAIEKGKPLRRHLHACFEQSKIFFLFEINRGAECVEYYEGLIKKEPDNCENYICGIAACCHAGQYERAKQLADAALADWPDNVMVCHLAGDVCEKLEQYDQAFRHWNKSVELNKKRSRETGENGFCDALYSIARCYQKLGDKENARKAWKEVADWLDERGFEIERDWPLKMAEQMT